MAAIATNAFFTDSPVSDAHELWNVNMNDVTSYVLTPSTLDSITSLDIIPTNATAAAAATSLYITYVYGGATLTINSAVNSTYLVKVYGKVAS